MINVAILTIGTLLYLCMMFCINYMKLYSSSTIKVGHNVLFSLSHYRDLQGSLRLMEQGVTIFRSVN